MANNFKLSGNGYFSKDGNDADTGLTPDLPKITPTTAFTDAILGTGQYKGAFALGATTTRTYNCDLIVLFELTGDLLFKVTSFNTQVDINTKTGSGYLIIRGNGFQVTTRPGSLVSTWNRVILENCTLPADAGFTELYDGVLENCTGNILLKYYKCALFNNAITISASADMHNTYVDSASVLTMSAYFTTPATQFINCNMQGQFNVASTLYELKRDKDGNAIDPNPAVSDIILIDATVYDRGNFSQNPEYLNIEKREYRTVANTSPMLFGADDNTNIANCKTGTLKKATDTEFSSGTITDLVTDTNDFVVDSPATTGNVVSQPIQIATIAQVIESIDFAELFNFDNLQTKGTSENTNVTISDNYTAGTAGANPRRLTFEMRWTDSDTQPSIDADWTNNGFVTAGDYSKFEQFTKPLIDVASLGNGDPSFNPSGASPIKAKWVQFRVTMYDGIG